MQRPQPADAAHLRERRRRLGAWYTPAWLVDHVVDRVLDGMRVPVRRALDPACGDGAFLAGVGRRAGERVELHGVDVDPSAVEATRAAIPGAHVEPADALALDWGDARFDVVVGNPPFLSQLAATTTRGGRSRFGGGPYADAAAEFLALAVQLVRPGGRVGLVLPQSLLTARDAAAIRLAVAERAALRHLWWSDEPVFDAGVRTCALVLEVGGVPAPVTRTYGRDGAVRAPVDVTGDRWGRLLLADPGSDDPWDGPTLGDRATFTVGFRSEYYALAAALRDSDGGGDGDGGPPLVTSGLIDAGVCRWGAMPARIAKRTFAAPRVDVRALDERTRRWVRDRLVPKVLVANQTRSIESVIDRTGAWVPGVPVIAALPHDGADADAALDHLHRALGSPEATRWAWRHAAGSGLSATSIRLSPALLASIPDR